MTSPRQQLMLDATAVLDSEQGRRFLRDLIERACATGRASYTGEQTHQTAYLEGRRSVGIELTEFLRRADASLFERLVVEGLRSPAPKAEDTDG